MTVAREKRLRLLIHAGIVCVVLLHLGQGIILHARLSSLSAEEVDLTPEEESCAELRCQKSYTFRAAHRFLLLGHIMRSHVLTDASTAAQVLPGSQVRGTKTDSWSWLRVYPVEPGRLYRLTAEKPLAVRMDYFVGVRPRTTNDEGVLSVPDISPTVTLIASLVGLAILGLLLLTAHLAPKSGEGDAANRFRLNLVSVASLAVVAVALLGSGAVDSLLPDGELRSKLLRSALFLSITMVPLGHIFKRFTRSTTAAIAATTCVVPFLTLAFWPYLRAGVAYIACYSSVVLLLALFLFRAGHRVAAGFATLGLVDALRMLGVLVPADLPPIYVFQPIVVASFSLVATNLGSVSVLALAAKAYQRFTRDLALAEIVSDMDPRGSAKLNSTELTDAVQSVLPKIAALTGAGRATVLINLPLARPITFSYDANSSTFITHDDGKIPGAITVRAFVYGDEAWFERYSEFASRLSLLGTRRFPDAEFVCVAPIRVTQTTMGVLMLTQFDDRCVDRQISTGDIDFDRETARRVVDVLAAKFSQVVIDSLKSSTDKSSELLRRLREAIPRSTSTAEFLNSFCEALYEVTDLRVILHLKVENSAVAVAQCGFEEKDWQLFVEAPFNLASQSRPLGSTVIAFLEGRTSYVKDWREISEKLHPRTVRILDEINARSFMAVPLHAGPQAYVATLVSRGDQQPRDPGLLKIVESAEAIFDAAVAVLDQRTSVLALGKLANRLIGDDEVRAQIVDAAKQEHLQTTIGSPRTSFLLLFDLAGSSNLPADTEEKARSYGRFYDEVNRVSSHLLGGKVRKTIGDAVIVTWDGTNVRLEDNEELLSSVAQVILCADAVARAVDCKGARAVLHHGDYFFGLIGTSSFGQIDVIGKGIDEVCKMEGVMKGLRVGEEKAVIAISSAAAERLHRVTDAEYCAFGYSRVENTAGQSAERWTRIDWVCADAARGLSQKAS